MKFSVLASGSKANSTVVVSRSATLLIDCGLSAKETFVRLRSVGLTEDDLSGILITHEHDDHIRGVRALAKAKGLQVFMTQATYFSSSVLRSIDLNQIRFIDPYTRFFIEDIEVLPFSVSHDAADPVCYKFSAGGKAFGILSDLGCFSDREIKLLADVDGLLLEANHDLDMLWKTHYPWHIKERIAGNRGHLSNECASRFLYFLEKKLSKIPKVVLAAHISENSNTPNEARSALMDAWKGTVMPHFDCAPQYESTDLYEL